MDENNVKINEKKETKNIKIGVVLSYVRLIILVAVSIFYPPFLVASIGKELNGLYQFAASIPGWLALLSLGTENAYVRFATIAEEKGGEEELKKVNGFFLIFFGLIALLVTLVGVGVAFAYRFDILHFESESSDLNGLLAILIIILVVSWAIDFATGIFARYIYFRARFAWNQLLRILARVIIVGGAVAACLLFKDKQIEATIGVALATLIAQIVLDFGNAFLSIKKLKMRFSFSSGEYFKKMLGQVIVFSVFIFLAIIFNTVNLYLGRTALGSLYTVSAVTIFAYSIQFYDYGEIISKSVSDNFAPRINRYVVQNRDEEIKKLFLRVSAIQMVIMFLVVGGFIACGREFVYAWMSKSGMVGADKDALFFMSAALLIIWLIPFCQALGVEIQRAYNKHKFIAVFNIGAAIVNIILTVVLVKFLPDDLKIYGPVIGMAVAVIAGMVVASNIYYSKVIKLPIGKFFIYFGVMLLITSFAAGMTYLLYHFVKLPEDMNKWYVTIIRAVTFVILYIPPTAIVFRKEIKAKIDAFKNRHNNNKDDEEAKTENK